MKPRQLTPTSIRRLLLIALIVLAHLCLNRTQALDFERILSFGLEESQVLTGQSALIQGSDGALYGTAPSLGYGNYGSVYRVNPDGTGYEVLHQFNDQNTGASPHASLLKGSDGALYGTTLSGGSSGAGTVFEIQE